MAQIKVNLLLLLFRDSELFSKVSEVIADNLTIQRPCELRKTWRHTTTNDLSRPFNYKYVSIKSHLLQSLNIFEWILWLSDLVQKYVFIFIILPWREFKINIHRTPVDLSIIECYFYFLAFLGLYISWFRLSLTLPYQDENVVFKSSLFLLYYFFFKYIHENICIFRFVHTCL